MMVANQRLSLGEFAARVFVALLIVVLFLGAWMLRDALMLIFLAVIIAIALEVPVNRLRQWGVSRGLSVLISLLGLILVVALMVILIVPTFVEQINNLVSDLPDAYEQFREEYDVQAENHAWLPDIDWERLTEGDVADFAMDQASNLSRNIFPFLSGVGGVLANLIFIGFISLFFVTDPTNYMEALLTLVPRGYRPRALDILVELGSTLRRWFIGQLISMTMLGTLIAIVMGVIMGLPNPIALGVIAGVLEFVPNFGSIVSVIPGVLIALADDPAKVPWVIAAYLITQQIQSNLIMPRIMSRQVSVPAASVLIAQVLAAALFGFVGLILALPLAIVVMVLVREIYVYDILNVRKADIQVHTRPDGTQFAVVTSEMYRPEQLSPGEAAKLRAQGRDIFQLEDGQIVEIITPNSPESEQAARSQQAVWAAILTLAAVQGLALIRSVLQRDD